MGKIIATHTCVVELLFIMELTLKNDLKTNSYKIVEISMENKYQRAKIYKLIGNGLTYYGSTCEPTLARRLATHKGDYNKYINGKGRYITSFEILSTGNYDIVLVENYPCNSKDELHSRERHWIETNECINKIIPCRTKKNIIKIT